MFDSLVSLASQGIMQLVSFIAEEILAEPAPLTQWGMEAIGSGVSEPVKAAWNTILQVAKELFCEALPWLTGALIDGLFGLANLGLGS